MRRDRCFEQQSAGGVTVRVHGTKPLPQDLVDALEEAAFEYFARLGVPDASRERELIADGLIDLGGESG